MFVLSTRSTRSLFLMALLCGALFAPCARASDAAAAMNISTAIQNAATKQNAVQESTSKLLAKELDDVSEELKQTILTATAMELEAMKKVTPDTHSGYALGVLEQMPNALALMNGMVSDLMTTRLNEMNRMAPNAEGSPRAAYLIDASQPDQTINAQIFDIFMRYFCDPRARGGTMAKVGKERGFEVYSVTGNQKQLLGCGSLPGGDPSMSRDGIFGPEQTSTGGTGAAGSLMNAQQMVKEVSRNQIKNLSIRPADLFFEPITYPVYFSSGKDEDTGDSADTFSNVNQMGPVYFGAFAQAMQFLIGTPPDALNLGEVDTPRERTRYIEAQGQIARKMLATYPFALLYAERMGSIPAGMVGGLYATVSETTDTDMLSFNKMIDLMNRKNISMAEYMDLVMYRIPMSPGYIKRLQLMTASDLKREEVWLTAMQNVVNYQRNRWMEILVALEAVK